MAEVGIVPDGSTGTDPLTGDAEALQAFEILSHERARARCCTEPRLPWCHV